MRAFTTTLLLLSLLPLAGCDELPWGRDGAGQLGGGAHALGPATTYERRLLFLATGPDLPATATFDFTAVIDSAGLRREAGIRLAADGRWTELLDGAWFTDAIREPWRILPHGELRVIVSDAGEIDALALDSEPGLRIEIGPRMAESSPVAGTQLVLQNATLTTTDSAYDGVLLDAQVGRARDATTPTATSIEALLAHGANYHAVVFRVTGGLVAWVNDDGESRIHRGVRLEGEPRDGGSGTAGLDTAGAAATGAEEPEGGPVVWRIVDPPELSGRVSAEIADSAAATGYTLVSGWIEEDGVRRDVFGLVRHAR